MSKNSHPNMILLGNVTDGRVILDELKSVWQQKRAHSNNPEKIDKLIKSVETKLKRTNISDLALITLSSELSILKGLIGISSNLTYDDISALSSSGDQIKDFLEYSPKLNDSQYWEKLRNAYLIQDYTQISYDVLRELFTAKRSDKEKLMNEEELEIMKSLPEMVTVFRGCTGAEEKQKKYGLSWTLNREIAEMFASKKVAIGLQGVVIERQIDKCQIIAYFKERNEEEIILIPQTPAQQSKNSFPLEVQ